MLQLWGSKDHLIFKLPFEQPRGVLRFGLGLLLALTCAAAAAEWDPVFLVNKDVIYADRTSVRRVGKFAKMWSLANLEKPESLDHGPFRSMTMQHEFDCEDEQERTLFVTMYSGAMAAGRVVATGAPSDSRWKPVAPQTMAQMLWKVACDRE